MRVAPLQVPEVVEVAIGEDDKPAALRSGVLSGLLFAGQRVAVFRLGLEHDEGKSPGVQQEEVDESPAGLLEVVSERVEVSLGNRDVLFKSNVGRSISFLEEAPTVLLKQSVDLDARCRLVHVPSTLSGG